MKVLLSAYSCEPNRGSEPEVGWQRALHMRAYADEVWVITRANNREAIEAESASRASGLHFIYYDLPQWVSKLKKQTWFLPIYFVLWQWGAYRTAKKSHRENHFDCVYHVTFATMLYGSFMGRLGIPFIIGPIGGGERAPFRLRRSMPILDKLKELLRDIGIALQRYSPLSNMAFGAAERIYVVTPDSLRLLRTKWHGKAEVQINVATRSQAIEQHERPALASPRFVFTGRMLHWKGAHLAIRALGEARKIIPAATLTLIGRGPDALWLSRLAAQCGVTDAVEFIDQLPLRQFSASLSGYSSMVFPSLHDSGGLVVLEAFSRGLPVICLDLGGPGTLVNESCGIVVSTKGMDEDQTVNGLAQAMIVLGTMPAQELARLSKGAIARANELSWAELTRRVATDRYSNQSVTGSAGVVS
jgi:glycosyltransferase involved in cell wall biosynthesis